MAEILLAIGIPKSTLMTCFIVFTVLAVVSGAIDAVLIIQEHRKKRKSENILKSENKRKGKNKRADGGTVVVPAEHGEFDKLKRKYLRRAVVCGAACGILCGLLVTGALLLALKTCAVALAWYYYLLAGICAAAVCGATVFFALRPTDKKLAKKLDRIHALDEKTQTMIEYEGKQGAMLDKQREDTETSLKAVPARKPTAVNIVLKAAAAAVAVALFVAGVALPLRSAPVQAEIPYEVKEELLARLRALIKDVEGDTILVETASESYAETLDGLLSDLTSEGITAPAVTQYVQESMYDVSETTIDVNTYDDIAYSLTVGKETYFSDALRSGAAAYKDINTVLTSYSVLSEVNDKLFNKIDGYIQSAGDEFGGVVYKLTDEDADGVLSTFVNALAAALKSDGLKEYYDALIDGGVKFGGSREKIASGDALYDAVYDLYSTSYTAYSRYNGTGAVKYQLSKVITEIAGDGSGNDGAIHTFIANSVPAMQTQAYTYMADAYIRTTLGSIFGVDVVGRAVNDGSSESGEGSTDPEISGPGGDGTGETLYPGNDYIYNPETGEYTFYAELLDSGYRQKLNELLDSDEISDEVKNYIRAYLNYLINVPDAAD